jgi:hypothetical protein
LKTQSEKDVTAAALPNPPKVIIFDFDDVILDSANIKLGAYSAIYSGEDPKKLAALITVSALLRPGRLTTADVRLWHDIATAPNDVCLRG